MQIGGYTVDAVVDTGAPYVVCEPGLVDATVFVPDLKPDQAWGDLPSFIGLSGCLERMRFAVDPATEMFYFGPLGEG